MHQRPVSTKKKVRSAVLPAVVEQFRRYLSQPHRPSESLLGRTGQALARLIASNPKVVQSFKDHAAVARQLMRSDEAETLRKVIASGLLRGIALQFYRMALDYWLNR